MSENDQRKNRFWSAVASFNAIFGSVMQPTEKRNSAPADGPGASAESCVAKAKEFLIEEQWSSAISWCQRALALRPDYPEGLCTMGIAFRGIGDSEAAVECFRKAIALDPELVDAHYKLGTVCQASGRIDEAITSFENAVRYQPNMGDAHYNLGTLWQSKRQWDAAARHYEAAIACNEDDADAHNNLGLVYAAREDHEAAAACFHRVLALRPGDLNACNNLGAALLRLNRLDESIEWCKRALSLQPDCIAAHINIGAVLLKQNHFDQAIDEFQRVIALQPDDVDSVEAYTGLGAAFTAQRRFAEAEATYFNALRLQADCDVAHGGLGLVYSKSLNFEAAIESFKRCLAINPESNAAQVGLFHAQRQICDWDGQADTLSQTVRQAVRGETNPWILVSITDSAPDQLQCAQNYVKTFGFPRAAFPSVDRKAHQRIRVGYVSSDFRNHPVAMLLVGVLECHERRDFEVITLSTRPDDQSELGVRIRRASDRHIDVSGASDLETVQLMRELELDIAVDLAGFTDGGRLGVFANRPSPVQVNFLGYPGTLGADFYDYIIADPVVIPPEHRSFYSESVVYLPDTFLPTDAATGAIGRTTSRAEQGLPDDGFVFCSFNNSYKFNAEVFAVWMRLLAQLDGSVLWLPQHRPKVRENLCREAARHGISRERLVFANFTETHAQHLARLRLADLFLDTLPYNAHTTAADALRAGLPILTCLGGSFAARVAGSLLSAVGIPDLITRDLREYEVQALRLASDRALLARLRATLEMNLNVQPLFNTARYTRHLEAAYRTMHGRSLQGVAPNDICVPQCGL